MTGQKYTGMLYDFDKLPGRSKKKPDESKKFIRKKKQKDKSRPNNLFIGTVSK